MARAKQTLVFLDTHVVVWLYDALENKFSAKAKEVINAHMLYVSPLVKLELAYLLEVGKIKDGPDLIVASLKDSIDLQMSDPRLDEVVEVALAMNWTRDPFDRLLVGEAHARNAYFVTADQLVRKHYPLALW